MMNLEYFIAQAAKSTQREFELDFADIIEVYDVDETTITTQDGRTVIIHWYSDGTFMSYKVIYETQLMEDASKFKVVKEVIAKLQAIDVDGETMQYILNKVGMEDQILRQLVLTQPFDDVEYVWEERKNLQ
jgi:hypothetical protein